jgi:acetyl/propionyl-CoA carboxylase alpha subunit
MISKLAVWGRDRTEAIARMRRALGEFVIAGELTTNLDFHRWLMNHPVFLSGDYDTNFIEQEYHPRSLAAADGKLSKPDDDPEFAAAMLAAAAAAQNLGNGRAPEAAGAGRSTARGASAWKMLGRLDVLRR